MIGKNVQNGKTEQTPKAPFGVWQPEARRSSCFYFVSAIRRNSFFARLLLCKIEKCFSILRGKTATKVNNGIFDIVNTLKRVLTKRRSFFVTKWLFIKKKNLKKGDFSTTSSNFNFIAIFYKKISHFVIWRFLTSLSIFERCDNYVYR